MGRVYPDACGRPSAQSGEIERWSDPGAGTLRSRRQNSRASRERNREIATGRLLP
jgi:hypothetical protein